MENGNRFYIRAYGCQMNVHEADLVRDILRRSGFSEVGTEDAADVVLLLTCSVREHAEQRAIGRLQNLRGLKRQRPELVLGVLGCMAQLRARELANGLGADLVLGPDEYRRLPELVAAYRAERRPQVATRLCGECYTGVRPRVFGGVRASISVIRGCDNYCAYCIVPYVRGPERSKPAAAVLDEFEHLAGAGAKDVTLLGQNVLAYRDGAADFSALLREVDARAAGVRVRFLTSHPKDVTRDFAATLSGLRNWCPQMHLPLQSGSDPVLQRMNRRYTSAEYRERVTFLRAALPGLSLTTDILVGFPGETDEDFARTLACLEELRFDFAYMFRFSARPGTRAAEMEPQVPDAVARDRLSRLIGLQSEITKRQAGALLGQRLEVLVEARTKDGCRARTRTNKVVVVPEGMAIGSIHEVEIVEVRGWTPLGRPLSQL